MVGRSDQEVETLKRRGTWEPREEIKEERCEKIYKIKNIISFPSVLKHKTEGLGNSNQKAVKIQASIQRCGFFHDT